MQNTVIKLENIGKQYRLGTVGSGTLRGDMQRWWAQMRGKEDPNLKIGQENKLDAVEGEYVWALRNINLEVQQGEILGIIGKNGAGKSTLLKLLSRVTTPTTGQIKVKGRIASLLEVGTGFHGELTGRENIFLNGAILGMTKQEIRRKFDEIVDFAGVAKYIDTPVKRYSSGMYVRLAFAVAAHLEPEILIVDEVLAVGDAEFQKKAIGKMQDISSGGGRTVLFVSHNMASVRALCTTGIMLENGRIFNIKSDINEVIGKYLENKNKIEKRSLSNKIEIDELIISDAEISPLNGSIFMSSEILLKVGIIFKRKISDFLITIHLYDEMGTIVFGTSSINNQEFSDRSYSFACTIPGNLLNSGLYNITLLIVHNAKALHIESQILTFNISDDAERQGWYGKLAGVVRPKLDWKISLT